MGHQPRHVVEVRVHTEGLPLSLEAHFLISYFFKDSLSNSPMHDTLGRQSPPLNGMALLGNSLLLCRLLSDSKAFISPPASSSVDA